MHVLVGVGEKVPVDASIIDGASEVDSALITGETTLHPVGVGAKVFAGSVNVAAPITVVVIKEAEDTVLSDIVRMIEQGNQSQSRYVRLADRASRAYTPVVHAMALMAFLGWVLIGGMDWQPAVMIAVTVLIITCPCALGLAVPVVQVLASGQLMKKGVILKSGDALERLAKIDTVFTDKTGTLTYGCPALLKSPNEDALQMAVSMAVHSAHPLSKGLVKSYTGDILSVTDVHEQQVQGQQGLLNGTPIFLGQRSFCQVGHDKHMSCSELWVRHGDHDPVQFQFSDHVRCDSQDTIRSFENKGLSVALLSGDKVAVTQGLADQQGIDEVHSACLPADKNALLEKRQAEGHVVAMLGDGFNECSCIFNSCCLIAGPDWLRHFYMEFEIRPV